MEIFVGTSGWSNPLWNPNGLSWYTENSGLNAVELNMSFYQLPTVEQVESWAQEGKSLSWSVKINRSVTHFFRFNEIAFERFLEFKELFKALDKNISHYLFQLPPDAHPSYKKDIENFFAKTGLGARFALEWRNPRWFTKDHLTWAKDLGLTIVSADSPQVPREIINTNGIVYLRLHGRSDWFTHHYSRKELERIVEATRQSGCSKVLAFLNNDSSQLKNARALFQAFSEKIEDN